MMSVLIPIFVGKTNASLDLERACHSIDALSSFSLCADPLTVDIIAPMSDLAVVETRLKRHASHKIAFRFWADEEFVHDSVQSGWVKQQIIKLSFVAKSASQFVLILDADIMCCHPFRIEDFFVEGRCINSWEGRKLHPWYEASSELLGIKFQSDGWGISVTPEVLARNICAELIVFLDQRFGSQWQKEIWELNRNGVKWSEYSLYTVFAENSGLLETYHASPNEVFSLKLRLNCSMSNWSAGAFATSQLNRVFRKGAPAGIFVVNQSTTKLAPSLSSRMAMQIFRVQSPIVCDREWVLER